MAVVNGLAQKDISSAFAGLGSDFLSASDLAKLQESTMKDLSRFMDKTAPQQKPIETKSNPFMRSGTVPRPVPNALAQAAEKRKKDAEILNLKQKSSDDKSLGVIGAFVSLFGRKEEKSSDDWNAGHRTA